MHNICMWEYLIEDAFYITGLGVVAVIGAVTGEVRNADRAELHHSGQITALPRVSVAFAHGKGGERLALTLSGLSREQLPAPGDIVRGRPELRPMPAFAYHPDPVQTGSIRASDTTCVCCDRNDGWIYTGPVYAETDLSEKLCPWCIHDGTAATRFAATFTDASPGPDIPHAAITEVLERTPGYAGWQQAQWMFHCGDAATFLGPVGAPDLARWPQASAAIRAGLPPEWPTASVDDFMAHLNRHGQPTGYLFMCRKCHEYLGYADST
jgi:uncharacterized protein